MKVSKHLLLTPVAALCFVAALGSTPVVAASMSAPEKSMVDEYKKAMTQFEAALNKCLVHANETGDRSTCVTEAKQAYRVELTKLDQKYN